MNVTKPFEFSIVPGHVVDGVIRSNFARVVDLIAETYLTHSAGLTVNPASMFLRFPDRPNARIIALPAHIGGSTPISGLKWIASFPDNIDHDIPRASAVLLLNSAETGYPFACLESSIISAARTAASATLAARTLIKDRQGVKRIAIVGAGVIARYIADFLIGTEWPKAKVAVYDHVPRYSSQLANHFVGAGWSDATAVGSIEEAIKGAQLVVFATTARSPHLFDSALFAETAVVLNVSLRDLAPSVILSANNVLDDVDHCLTAETSPHLTEQETGNRDFVTGTLADVLNGNVILNRPTTIFSPFGLGVLDVALGHFAYEQAVASGGAIPINDFFFERTRWSTSPSVVSS
ncbi:2,3-diaminopropionate biosynthesis protein SbnB [Rhizobium rhizogenes]|uniref:2,3-diaminopropionate biosynthesis protein SbnB n=1 Tax=Rhizobium rhizogenes TaxID=359 RepID=UPI001573FA12|nr:2,3-diaminopropionate biosynthesis protein SbnB [Rhizobium rhizogenes]NTG02970.1 2,3-diaminopropionate biosynthesis protein SbnB [Rhizobium rhizogenes]NTG10033.1 2,3-diaminopropionate biosynthesis protein SbnB [Rhizobium rhizogenes]